jgi:hypothetical protein
VKIEGNTVAIRGSSFGSMGDIASKGTGGGIISMNCEGPTKFLAPGSLTVKIEGKSVHLLGDIMANNHNPAGAAPNSATMMGALHQPGSVPVPVSAECQEAADTIQEVMHGSPNYKSIKKREAEVKANPQQQPVFWADANPGVPRPPGSDQWGHLEQIEGQQNRMNKALQKYYANGCTNMDGPTLKEAGAYAVADPLDML